MLAHGSRNPSLSLLRIPVTHSSEDLCCSSEGQTFGDESSSGKPTELVEVSFSDAAIV